MHADPGRALLLFAQPRGGSTWLEQILRTIPATATIWEPLDIANVPELKALGFGWRQHIPEHGAWPEAQRMFADLLAGRILSPALTFSSTCEELRSAERLIIKFCRGDMLLPWVVRHFEIPPPILLLRHPCAVISSQLRLGGWDQIPEDMTTPEIPFNDIYKEHEHLFALVKTREERMAAFWCLSTGYLLRHPKHNKAWIAVTYEEMVTNGPRTLQRIFDRIGVEMPNKALDKLKKPSRTTRPGSRVEDPMAQLQLWKKHLTPQQIDRILKMVDAFGIELYGDDPMPYQRYTE